MILAFFRLRLVLHQVDKIGDGLERVVDLMHRRRGVPVRYRQALTFLHNRFKLAQTLFKRFVGRSSWPMATYPAPSSHASSDVISASTLSTLPVLGRRTLGILSRPPCMFQARDLLGDSKRCKGVSRHVCLLRTFPQLLN